MTSSAPNLPLVQGSPAAERSSNTVAPSAPASAVPLLPAREVLRDRALRIGRTLLVGAAASLFDLAVLTVCIRVFGLESTLARALALVSSGLVAFFGNRSFAFRAQAGRLPRQAWLFGATEVASFFLNLGFFRLLQVQAAFIPPEVASQASNTLAFLLFQYPMRALVVFRVPAPVPSLPLPPERTASEVVRGPG